jgi:hypothetical protein
MARARHVACEELSLATRCQGITRRRHSIVLYLGKKQDNMGRSSYSLFNPVSWTLLERTKRPR